MPEEVKEERHFCVFGIGEREFLVPKEVVAQIVDITKIFPIPGSPDYIVGALPVRGKIIPAIDLAKVYNVERLNYSDNKLIVLEIRGDKIGILSDITPFFVSFDKDLLVDDFLDPEKLYDQLMVKQPTSEQKNQNIP